MWVRSFLTLRVPDAFRTCMPAGAENFCAFCYVLSQSIQRILNHFKTYLFRFGFSAQLLLRKKHSFKMV